MSTPLLDPPRAQTEGACASCLPMINLQRFSDSVMSMIRGCESPAHKKARAASSRDGDGSCTQLQIMGKPCTRGVLNARVRFELPGTRILIGQRLGRGTYGSVYVARLPLTTDDGDILYEHSGAPMYQTDYCALKVFDMDVHSSDGDQGSIEDIVAEEPPLPCYMENEVRLGLATRNMSHVVGLKMRRISVPYPESDAVPNPLQLDTSEASDCAQETDSGWEVGPFLVPKSAEERSDETRAPVRTRIFVMPLWRMDLENFRSRVMHYGLNTPEYYRVMLQLLYQVAQGMHELHRKGICHFDIKAHNVLVEYSGGEWRAAISDLSIALQLTPPQPKDASRYHSNHDDARTASSLQSPEMCMQLLQPSFATDVWQWGLMAISLLAPTNASLVTCEIEADARSVHGADCSSVVLRDGYNRLKLRGWKQEVWDDPHLFVSTPNRFVGLRQQIIDGYDPAVWALIQSALTCDPKKRIMAERLVEKKRWTPALNGTVPDPHAAADDDVAVASV